MGVHAGGHVGYYCENELGGSHRHGPEIDQGCVRGDKITGLGCLSRVWGCMGGSGRSWLAVALLCSLWGSGTAQMNLTVVEPIPGSMIWALPGARLRIPFTATTSPTATSIKVTLDEVVGLPPNARAFCGTAPYRAGQGGCTGVGQLVVELAEEGDQSGDSYQLCAMWQASVNLTVTATNRT